MLVYLQVHSASFRFSPVRYLRFRFLVLTASRPATSFAAIMTGNWILLGMASSWLATTGWHARPSFRVLIQDGRVEPMTKEQCDFHVESVVGDRFAPPLERALHAVFD